MQNDEKSRGFVKLKYRRKLKMYDAICLAILSILNELYYTIDYDHKRMVGQGSKKPTLDDIMFTGNREGNGWETT